MFCRLVFEGVCPTCFRFFYFLGGFTRLYQALFGQVRAGALAIWRSPGLFFFVALSVTFAKPGDRVICREGLHDGVEVAPAENLVRGFPVSYPRSRTARGSRAIVRVRVLLFCGRSNYR